MLLFLVFLWKRLWSFAVSSEFDESVAGGDDRSRAGYIPTHRTLAKHATPGNNHHPSTVCLCVILVAVSRRQYRRYTD